MSWNSKQASFKIFFITPKSLTCNIGGHSRLYLWWHLLWRFQSQACGALTSSLTNDSPFTLPASKKSVVPRNQRQTKHIVRSQHPVFYKRLCRNVLRATGGNHAKNKLCNFSLQWKQTSFAGLTFLCTRLQTPGLCRCCDRKTRAAKLRTAAASNNRDHSSQSLLPLLARAMRIYFCSSRTSCSWWITQSTQHHRRGCNIGIVAYIVLNLQLVQYFVISLSHFKTTRYHSLQTLQCRAGMLVRLYIYVGFSSVAYTLFQT